MSTPGASERQPTRSRVLVRVVTYGVVAALAAAALTFVSPIDPPKPAGAVLAERSVPSLPVAPAPAWREHDDTLAEGETLASVLARGGVTSDHVLRALSAAAATLDLRRIPAGMPVTLRARAQEREPSEIVFHLGDDRLVYLRRTAEGWIGAEKRLPWTTDTVVVQGEISSTLYEALEHGASALPPRARTELAWSLADIFEYRIDMSRDLQEGDSVRVLVERARSPQGATRMGRILAAAFTLSGSSVEAFRLQRRDGSSSFFDQTGRSLGAAFLRAPLQFRRISSVFGMRRHPILGIWRAHKGTDYAAAMGTPVRAIGDAQVVFAGRKSGYGNVVDLRHRNGYVTRYGHLRSFARGLRVGAHVAMGQTIAFVGMSGLATAPHLHFEVLVDGRQRDPRVALATALRGGDPIESGERAEFSRVRERLLAFLTRRDTRVATTN